MTETQAAGDSLNRPKPHTHHTPEVNDSTNTNTNTNTNDKATHDPTAATTHPAPSLAHQIFHDTVCEPCHREL